ncbi:hypothetical protein ARMSODRAFT_608909 [Armillaria solidipes]|uniref:Uncharacterized protein n=1 Tax=Armillaria solidipes TaxID=1076256 RepID=A0A2H3BEK7_9AGAR|nr:hypothetical protein ARMSODRAFT_608909 [Armillaria solidipes]
MGIFKKISCKIASWLLVTDSESEDIDSEVREENQSAAPGPTNAGRTARSHLGGMVPIYNLDTESTTTSSAVS